MITHRPLWEPAIYEHKASLIGARVGDVAHSAELMVGAVEAEFDTYGSDFLTVGMDIYNIEAEACGAQVVEMGPEICPEIPTPLWRMDSLPSVFPDVDAERAGRFRLLLEAGRKLQARLGDRTTVRVAASGPVSIAAKLVGMDDLIMGLALEEEPAWRLLVFTADLSRRWCAAIRRAGLNVMLFDSTASPPVLSPEIYAVKIGPLHRMIMDELEELGQARRWLIMGGKTEGIVSALVAANATDLVCDYPADAGSFALCARDMNVRVNADPRLFGGSQDEILAAAPDHVSRMRHFRDAVSGTGILPFDTEPAKVLAFRDRVRELCR